MPGLDPAAQLHGFYNSGDGHHVGRVAHVDFFIERHFKHRVESAGEDMVFLLQHFLPGPVVVHVVLYGFKIGYGHTAAVAQEVGDHKDAFGLDDLVRFRRGGAVGAFGNDLHPAADGLDGFNIDLAFERSGDEHIHILADPGARVFNGIPGVKRFLLVEPNRTGQ